MACGHDCTGLDGDVGEEDRHIGNHDHTYNGYFNDHFTHCGTKIEGHSKSNGVPTG